MGNKLAKKAKKCLEENILLRNYNVVKGLPNVSCFMFDLNSVFAHKEGKVVSEIFINGETSENFEGCSVEMKKKVKESICGNIYSRVDSSNFFGATGGMFEKFLGEKLELDDKSIRQAIMEVEDQTKKKNMKEGYSTSYVKTKIDDEEKMIMYTMSNTEILDKCVKVWENDEEKDFNVDDVKTTIEKKESEGLYPLMFCTKIIKEEDFDQSKVDEHENDYTLLAIFFIKRKVTPGIKEFIKFLNDKKINVLTYGTFDKAFTNSVGKEIGLLNEGCFVKKFSEVSAEDYADKNFKGIYKLPGRSILQPLKSLENREEKVMVVSMCGPLLKSAYLGVTMGLTGTSVAKAASDMIILDDDITCLKKLYDIFK